MSDLFTVNSTADGVSQLDVPAPAETPVDFHTPFLERASDPDGEDSQHALGAFLTLRVVDQFVKEDLNAVGLGYQIASAVGYLADLVPRTKEVECLEAVLLAAKVALRDQDVSALIEVMKPYAKELEGQLKLDESLDVLATAIRIAKTSDDRTLIPLLLQRGRSLRIGGRLSQAREAYEVARQLAVKYGDSHAELRSRIGQGLVLQYLGNLPEAHRVLDEVRIDANRMGDREAEAGATHDLAVTAGRRNDHSEAVTYAFNAFRLYEVDRQKKRALADLGTSLQALGHYGAASDAFEIVLAGEIPLSMRIATTLELMGLATLTGNRVMFERRRREVETYLEDLPPSALVDYQVKVGVGLSEFGNCDAGRKHLQRAISYAEEHNLNDYLFKAELALEEIDETERSSDTEFIPEQSAPEEFVPNVVSVARELETMRAMV